MRAIAVTASGCYAVDLETGELGPSEEPPAAPAPSVSLPVRVLAAAESGSTVVAVVDTRPPLLVSHDAGATWSESGRGLPAGRSVAATDEDPDLLLYGARNRLYLSRDGGRFWEALSAELPEIERIALEP
jgi:hypothetical protein